MNLIEAKLELPLNGGHVFATVAHEEVVHVHAGDGVWNAVDLKVKRVTERTLPWGTPNSWSCGLERTVPNNN